MQAPEHASTRASEQAPTPSRRQGTCAPFPAPREGEPARVSCKRGALRRVSLTIKTIHTHPLSVCLYFFVFGCLHVVVCGLCMSVRVRASRWLLVSRLAQQIYTCVQGHAQTQQTCRAHKHTHKHMDTYARTHVAKGG